MKSASDETVPPWDLRPPFSKVVVNVKHDVEQRVARVHESSLKILNDTLKRVVLLHAGDRISITILSQILLVVFRIIGMLTGADWEVVDVDVQTPQTVVNTVRSEEITVCSIDRGKEMVHRGVVRLSRSPDRRSKDSVGASVRLSCASIVVRRVTKDVAEVDRQTVGKDTRNHRPLGTNVHDGNASASLSLSLNPRAQRFQFSGLQEIHGSPKIAVSTTLVSVLSQVLSRQS